MFTHFFRLTLTLAIVCSFFTSSHVFSAQAPDFKLEGQKKQVELSDYRGQVVYIDFWASWCQPCRHSFSWMNKMQSQYGKEGFKVIAINLDESRENANKFLKQIPAHFDVAFDPHGNTAKSFQVKAMPSSYIINKHGKIVHANLGFRAKDEKKLEGKIKSLVSQSTVASR